MKSGYYDVYHEGAYQSAYYDDKLDIWYNAKHRIRLRGMVVVISDRRLFP